MSFLSKLLYFIGSFCLLHSGFSSYEFTQYFKQVHKGLNTPLPLDIKIEAILGLLFFIIASFHSILISPKLSLIDNDPNNSDHTSLLLKSNQDSLFFKPIKMRKAMAEYELIGACPFQAIESKPSYIDILQRKNEFNQWLLNTKKEI
ncbi:Emc5p ASCRUDRAFT_38639 [Ascoidea rubescens DSM 1968]|uniref:ER membrane protein complex subunit 5 n=1 Tax=Ascoidea rubescens DSM 1968 TaxID=1344418 RepID=A0A1D2VBG3_9ASCO|nr:hypothetical protein ASCRUDRAFT_38639 [Ascoidea rubescens DSM 1968]ODV58797.1 hypothetical protein ASCRUDRAFT_38639 [Ascoidea rubescens DSM 1968]